MGQGFLSHPGNQSIGTRLQTIVISFNQIQGILAEQVVVQNHSVKPNHLQIFLVKSDGIVNNYLMFSSVLCHILKVVLSTQIVMLMPAVI